MSSRYHVMSSIADACPYEASTRAARCEGCCLANAITPCMAAFLRRGKHHSTRTQLAVEHAEMEQRAA